MPSLPDKEHHHQVTPPERQRAEEAPLLRDQMTVLGHLAAGMAHEIRNPLFAITIHLSNLARVLEKERTAPQQEQQIRAILEQMESASTEIEALVKRVTDFAAPQQPPSLVTDVNRALAAATELSTATLRKSGIELAQKSTTDLPPCLADQHLIEQVLLGLIINMAAAMRGTNGPKRIEVSATLQGDRVAIVVGTSPSGGASVHLELPVHRGGRPG